MRDFVQIPDEEYDATFDVDDAFFYHTIELPGIGLRRGLWDLRGCESKYLGGVDVRGKTFFDCGLASGFMAFEMERRGAHVIGLDVDVTQIPDMGLVPFHEFQSIAGFPWEEAIARRVDAQRRLRHSFLIGRQALQSKVTLLIGNIMYSPVSQSADGALVGSILLHLRDPVAALFNVARCVRETMIISDCFEMPIPIPEVRPAWRFWRARKKTPQPDESGPSLDESPNLIFRPSVDDPGNLGTWWYPTPSLLKRVLQIAGFRHFQVSRYDVKNDVNGMMVPTFTLVARR